MVKVVPVAKLDPPVGLVYQLIVPAEAVAPKLTFPGPQRDPGFVPVIIGLGFTTTFVVDASLVQPLTVAVTE